MAELNIGLNVSDLPEDDGFEPIPAGKYVCEIVGSEVVSTKNNDGTILKLTAKVVEGDYEGAIIFENMNIENRNEKTQKWALATLRKLCVAVGFDGHLNDSCVLHGIPMIANVTIKPEQNGYAAKNAIRTYEPYQSGIRSPAKKADVLPAAGAAPSFLKKSALKDIIDDDVPF